MKFTWKNSAQDVFRIAIFLQISLAVWGQRQTTAITTKSTDVCDPNPCQATEVCSLNMGTAKCTDVCNPNPCQQPTEVCSLDMGDALCTDVCNPNPCLQPTEVCSLDMGVALCTDVCNPNPCQQPTEVCSLDMGVALCTDVCNPNPCQQSTEVCSLDMGVALCTVVCNLNPCQQPTEVCSLDMGVALCTAATISGTVSMKMTSVTNGVKMSDKSTNQSPMVSGSNTDPLSTREVSQKTSAPATDNTSMIIIIIVLVAAVIVIFIAMVTAMYICCCKRDRTQPKGYSSPESNGKANGVTKDRPPSGHRLSDEMNRYESVNEKALVDKSGPSVDKPSVTNPTYYSNEGLVKEDESNYVNTPKDKRSSLEQSKTNTGNIFDNIDPTADTYEEQIELKPSESPTRGSSSEEKQTLEEPKSTTDEVPDKGRDTLAPPKPGVRRNVSNRGDNLIKLRPKPVPRARPVSRASQDDGGPAKDPARDEARDSLTEPPSPTANPEKQRLFRPPSKGRGPDGSDQAALLANVLRKSNTPRQVEDDNSDAKVEGTTYW